MAEITHITSQQIIGEWGSVEKFAKDEGISAASVKMLIYVDGARSKPVRDAMDKYGYYNLLLFEKELKKRNQNFGQYLESSGLNPVDLIETLREKQHHPHVQTQLENDGLWEIFEKKAQNGQPSEDKCSQ